MSRDGRPLRVIIFDRGVLNPYSLGLAGGLDHVGVAVTVAGPRKSGVDGIVAVYPRGARGEKLAKSWDTAVGCARLARLIGSFKPDVLHFQWAMPHDFLFARALRTLTKARIVFTVHNPLPRDSGYRWHTPMVHLADELIVHGPKLRADLLASHRLPEEHVHVVPHGNFEHAIVRYDQLEARRSLGLPADGPVFTFIGQLIARKGVDTLVEAFRLHCARGNAGTLVLAGAAYGVDLLELEHLAEPYRDRVRWLTQPFALPAEQIDLAVSAATQVVLPFHSATQSGSVLYAMTHGRCVVTTRVGELPDTVGGKGVLVPVGDPLALADALQLASDDPAECERLGRAARAYALEQLGWDRIARLTLAAYGSVPEGVGRRSEPVREKAGHA